MIEVRNPAEDMLLLIVQAIGREDRLGFRVAVRSNRVEPARERGVSGRARRAAREVLRERRFERLTGAIGQIALVQAIVAQMTRQADHDVPRMRARSLRAARNRWTRTVDSFRPVIALTSRRRAVTIVTRA